MNVLDYAVYPVLEMGTMHCMALGAHQQYGMGEEEVASVGGTHSVLEPEPVAIL